NVTNAVANGSHVIATGFLQGSLSTPDWSSQLDFLVDPEQLVHGQAMEVGFLDANLPTTGLDLLEIHISADGAPVADLSFTSAQLASAALHDRLVTIDPSLLLGSDIELQFVYRSTNASDRFRSDFVLLADLPEPAEALLVAMALAWVCLRRGRFV
ncbi:MAG TPA: hypothetical protein VMR50_12795, partial [Myxococcota bacterium]|nr:hypothetical protein [Myxococcota bacterium]